ncbi:MAG: DUF2029 domain-containing protein, partial [Gammaproteobacteria bacterium]|nr:DUF2029 domain-containing protein [Gammaproteobacteria bacterium]
RYIDNSMTRLVIIATAALWTPAILDMVLAQTGHLAALLAFILLWTYEKKPVLAGVALGLLAFKPQYAIPLGLVALSKQNWTLLISAAVTFSLSCLTSALLYGWEMWPAFWQNAKALNTTIFHMESWLGAAALLMQDNLAAINQLAIPVYGLGMLLLGSGLVLLGNRLDLLGAVSLAIAFTLVVSPNTHPYDLMLFTIPMLYIIRYFSMRMWFAVIVYLVFFLPNIFVPLSILRFCFLVLSFFLVLWIIRVQVKTE